MQLSLEILADWMAEYKPEAEIFNSTRKLQHVKLGLDEHALTEETLMVGLLDNAVHCMSKDGQLVFHNEPLETIFNALLEVFYAYNSWEKSLIQALHEDASWQQLVDLAEEVLDNPLYVINRHGQVLGITEKYVKAPIVDEWLEIAERRIITFKTFEVLKQYELLDVPRIVKLDPPWVYYMQHALDQKDRYNLILYVVEWNRKLGVRDIHLCQAFQEIVEQFRTKETAVNQLSIETIFIDLLEGKPVGAESIERVFWQLQWPADSHFHLIALKQNDTVNMRKDLLLVGHLKKYLPHCICFVWNGAIIILTSGQNMETAMYQLKSQLIRNQNYSCGISMPFQSWSNLPGYHLQANLCIEHGRKHDQQITLCSQHIDGIILQLFSNFCNTTGIHHFAVQFLADYDACQGTELLHTLYEYISLERNAVRTAKALNIHRNTLIYRLRMIEDLYPEDWDDSMNRIYFLLSCKTFFLKKDALPASQTVKKMPRSRKNLPGTPLLPGPR